MLNKIKNLIKKSKQNIYPLISIFIFVTIIILFLLSINFIFQSINKVFNINEDLVSQKIIKFNIEGFNKIKNRFENKATSTPLPPPPPPSPPVLDKKILTIKILNGTEKKGLASDLKKSFENNGFIIKEAGNALKSDYKKTNLSIKESKKDFLSLITDVLQNKYPDFIHETLLESEKFDAVIIIGAP